jgi:hypothetical protein
MEMIKLIWKCRSTFKFNPWEAPMAKPRMRAVFFQKHGPGEPQAAHRNSGTKVVMSLVAYGEFALRINLHGGIKALLHKLGYNFVLIDNMVRDGLNISDDLVVNLRDFRHPLEEVRKKLSRAGFPSIIEEMILPEYPWLLIQHGVYQADPPQYITCFWANKSRLESHRGLLYALVPASNKALAAIIKASIRNTGTLVFGPMKGVYVLTCHYQVMTMISGMLGLEIKEAIQPSHDLLLSFEAYCPTKTA